MSVYMLKTTEHWLRELNKTNKEISCLLETEDNNFDSVFSKC